ncbi:MAG TPA: ABC transporter ATP-binding protein [Devosiaceae bacterium]|jgi:iron(III) transport system ATP-binding protein|nr:ABC transporter ATP-binding protein [Devosiaceae bacterium]
MTNLALSDVTKAFGSTVAVEGVDLRIASGEFLALLGPSGCGKTTLLRLIAGLERPDAGDIEFDGASVAGGGRFVDPEDRHLGMVFQSYALWPTMTVAGNVGFGLRVRGVKRAERDQAVERALKTVGLAGLGTRKPSQLSGGQRQRAALARCLALAPRLILLDEPLANLDAHLRASMLDEFRRIHRDTGATFVFVTHDQSEAMTLADRIVVMDKGRIEQSGSPETLYSQPASAMVARFIGEGAVVPAAVERDPESSRLSFRFGGASIAAGNATRPGAYLAAIRPLDVSLVAANESRAITAIVTACVYRGGYYATQCRLPDQPGTSVTLHTSRRTKLDEVVHLRIEQAWMIAAEAARS